MQKIILFLLLLIPISLKAESCDYNIHERYMNYAKNITYQNDFSKSKQTFQIEIYNISPNMRVVADNRRINVDQNDTAIISSVRQGQNIKIEIYAPDNCENAVKTIYVNEPYYNEYYNSEMCKDYMDKLSLCSSQFTIYKVSEDILKDAIYNYNNVKVKEEKQEEGEIKPTIIEQVVEFATNYGLKISIFFLSVFLSYVYYSVKLRKLKHGI